MQISRCLKIAIFLTISIYCSPPPHTHTHTHSYDARISWKCANSASWRIINALPMRNKNKIRRPRFHFHLLSSLPTLGYIFKRMNEYQPNLFTYCNRRKGVLQHFPKHRVKMYGYVFSIDSKHCKQICRKNIAWVDILIDIFF